MTAVVALTERVVRSALRDSDLMFAVIVPVGTFIGFTVALQNLIDTGGMSYSQFVLPAVVVQTMVFGALTTVDRAARESSSGFAVRLRTLPISGVAPLMARMLYCLIRGAIGIIAALAIGYAFGFRMTGGVGYAVAFIVLPLLLTLALSLGADATGARATKTHVSSQLLLLPCLLLVLLSTGMAPADAFPEWVQPFVRYQPISQVIEALRGFADGNVAAANLATSLAWCFGLLLVFGALATHMHRRRQ